MCIRLESSAKKVRLRKTISAAISKNAVSEQMTEGSGTETLLRIRRTNGARL